METLWEQLRDTALRVSNQLQGELRHVQAHEHLNEQVQQLRVLTASTSADEARQRKYQVDELGHRIELIRLADDAANRNSRRSDEIWRATATLLETPLPGNDAEVVKCRVARSNLQIELNSVY